MANKEQNKEQRHDHPGGSAAVLGVRVMRNSSVQAISLVVANVMQLVSILVVAAFLGPAEMARYGLLMFLAGLVTQVASLPPGTLAELRADAERLRELTGRDFSNWKIWDA